MTTIVVNNQKGGVGKTTLACHLVWHLADEGKRVALIDLDIQGNATDTFSEARKGGMARQLFDGDPIQLPEDLSGVTLFEADRSLSEINDELVYEMIERFDALKPRFDYIVFDTPPGWGWATFAAFAVTDSLVAPTDLKHYALQGIRQLQSNIAGVNQSGVRTADIRFLGLLVSRFNSNKPREREALQQLIAEVGAIVFDGHITERTSYSDSSTVKEPVWRLPGTAARAASNEIRTVLDRIKTLSERAAA